METSEALAVNVVDPAFDFALYYSHMKHVVIDTDGGADDLLALALLLAHPLTHIATIIASYGIYTVEDARQRLFAALNEISPTAVPIVKGSALPLRQDFDPFFSIHGTALVAQAKTSISLWKKVQSRMSDALFQPPKLTTAVDHYLAIGPLTNLARIAKTNDVHHLKHITIMGGSLFYPGNATLVSEANLFLDPDATELVLALNKPISLIPLNITDQVVITKEKINHLHHSSFWHKIYAPYLRHYQQVKKTVQFTPGQKPVTFNGAAIHDVVAAASLINPKIFTFQQMKLSLQHVTHPTTRGMVVPIVRGEHQHLSENVVILKVATGLNLKEFWQTFDQHLEAK